jgi:AraC-like DNA-binding protein
MTYYNQEFLKIRAQHFPKQYITEHLSKARKFIDDNCCSEIDLKAVSEFSLLSKYHFIRLFKRCYGRTPHQYLTEKRIELAKKLLCSKHSVIETCYELGFDSRNSFSAMFKKYVGVSPVEYRKKQFSIHTSNISVPILSFTKYKNDEN